MAYSRDFGEFNATERLKDFWANQVESVHRLNHNNFRDAHMHALPLARIKKIMKLDESVKTQMISAEVPVMLAKACEIFIEELTLRAWVHTEENKRKTLQKNDIAMAVSSDEQYDFLIDIVPREYTKHRKEAQTTTTTSTTTTSSVQSPNESLSYVIQLGSMGTPQSSISLAQASSVSVVPQNITVQSGTDSTSNQQAQSILQLITTPSGEYQLVQPIVSTGVSTGAQDQQTSLLHQVITSDGSTAYVPVQISSSDSVQLLKAQVMGRS